MGRARRGTHHFRGGAAHRFQSRLRQHHVFGVQRLGRVRRGLRPGHYAELVLEAVTFAGAVAGIIVGAVVDGLWLAFLSGTGIYEIIPAFAASMIAAIVASLLSKKPGKDVEELFDRALNFEEE